MAPPRHRLALTFSIDLSTGISLAALDPATLHQLGTDLRAVQAATQSRVSRQRVQSARAAWNRWSDFCASIGVDPMHLPTDPIPILQVFAQRLRSGSAAPSCRPVRSRTVEDTIRYVGQAYAGMGTADPRLNPHGAVDFRLTGLYQSWAKQDEPPQRVKPLPLTLLTQAITLAEQEHSAWADAIADCLILGFYFLLRPGEYLGVPNDTTDNLFRLRDLTLWVGSRALDLASSSITELQAATFAALTFTRQKNGVRNETIGHGRSGHRRLCPVLCLVARVIALRALNAPPATPLNAYCPTTAGHPLRYILPSDITRQLRNTLAIYPQAAYTAKDISARSTRAGGAMALLCAGIDRDRIRLVGRWRSDELYRYLHVQAQPVMTGLSAAMLRGGSFRLAPG
jgi:hypothetical protein